MSHTVFSVLDKNGMVVRTGEGSHENCANQFLDEGETLLLGEALEVTSFLVGDTFEKPPAKPSHYHEWDWTTKSWVPNLDAAREAKLQAVSTELNTRLYLPCNGFDADKISRERISGMIARLQRGDGLPAGWVGWRDAENTMHWSQDDAVTVLNNLTALSRAVEDREQALLVASWTHKANIAALEDIDAILAYDVTANWPV